MNDKLDVKLINNGGQTKIGEAAKLLDHQQEVTDQKLTEKDKEHMKIVISLSKQIKAL